LLSNWFFHGTLGASSCIRTILHILGLLVYGIFFKEKFEEVRNDVITGWWPMCVLSIFYTIYVIYITLTAQAVYFRDVDAVPFLLLLVAIITGYGVIFHTIHYMMEAALLLHDLQLLEKNGLMLFNLAV